MLDVEGKKMNNKGSSVVELSLVMPIVLGVVVMVLILFTDTISDGLIQQDGYSVIYTYQEKERVWNNPVETGSSENLKQAHTNISEGKYQFEKDGHVFITEVDVCSNRLRRWQVYGNIVWE